MADSQVELSGGGSHGADYLDCVCRIYRERLCQFLPTVFFGRKVNVHCLRLSDQAFYGFAMIDCINNECMVG